MGFASADGPRTSTAASFSNLLKSFVGAGILALPASFREGGIVASAVLLVATALVSRYCIALLLRAADEIRSGTHSQRYMQEKVLVRARIATKFGHFSVMASAPGTPRAAITPQPQPPQRSLTPELLPQPHPYTPLSNGDDVLLTGDDDENGALLSSDQLGSGTLVFNNSPAMLSSYQALAKSPAAAAVLSPAEQKLMSRTVFNRNVSQVDTYADVGMAAYGRMGARLTNAALITSQMGFCVAYVSFIGHNLEDVVPAVTRLEWTLIIFPVLAGLALIRDWRWLAPTALLGTVVYTFAVGVIFYYGFDRHCCASRDDIKFADVGGLPLTFGTCVFAMEGVGLVIPLQRGMEKPSEFSRIMDYAIMIVAIAYGSFACLGYLFFGSETKSVITLNLGDGALAKTVKVSLSIALLFTYALSMFPVSEICDFVISRKLKIRGRQDEEGHFHISGPDSPTPPQRRQYSELYDDDDDEATARDKGTMFTLLTNGARLGLVVFTCVLAGAFKNFGLIVSLVGSLSNGAMALVFPAAFYLKICSVSSGARDWRFYLAPTVVIVIGVAASLLGVFFTVKSMIDES